MIEYNNQIDDYNFQELIEFIECSTVNYKNMIFPKHNADSEFIREDEYLMVSPGGLGKVKLLGVRIDDHLVMVDSLDCANEQNVNVRIVIHDTRPHTYYFINWQDVKKIVLDDTSSGIMNDELLEFDF